MQLKHFSILWTKCYTDWTCYVYIDDILITSHTPQEYKEYLRLVLQRFKLYGILINPPKCMLGIQEL